MVENSVGSNQNVPPPAHRVHLCKLDTTPSPQDVVFSSNCHNIQIHLVHMTSPKENTTVQCTTCTTVLGWPPEAPMAPTVR